MRKSRLGYLFFILVIAILLFAFGTPFLLLLFLFLIAFGAILGIFIRFDAKRMELEMEFKAVSDTKEQFIMELSVKTRGVTPVSKAIEVELECQNRMFDSKETKHLMLPLEDRNSTYEIPISAEQCGELIVKCHGAYVYDLLSLFRIPIGSFGEMSTVIYPKRVQMQVDVSRDVYGRPKEEGQIQNRKGNDPSEMFDIRDYVPGDDVRAIHWKLSSKMDSLMLREPSDPSHYNLAVLLDLGLEKSDGPVSFKTITSAVTYSVNVMAELLKQKVLFCIVIPTKTGLKIYEIHENRDLRHFCSMWFGLPLSKMIGTGMKFFMSEHMEQNFTRLLVLTEDKYEHDLKGIDQRIGITVVGTTQGNKVLHSNVGSSVNMIELPEDIDALREHRIRC